MSIHIEWAEATSAHVAVLTEVQAVQALNPDDGINGSHVLTIGGDSTMAIEGDLGDLRTLAERILRSVMRAQGELS